MRQKILFVLGLILMFVVACTKPPTPTAAPNINFGSGICTGDSVPAEVLDDSIGVVTNRPSWCFQVRDPLELKKGQMLWDVTRSQRELIIILSESFIEDGKCRFEFAHPWSDFNWKAYCSDFGLVPYATGWNRWNHLEYTSFHDLPESFIDDLRTKLIPAP